MWTAELQLDIESWWGFGAWSCSGRYPVRRPSGLPPPAGTAAPRTAELQLGIESWWEPGAWSCFGRYPERRPSGLPPPAGTAAPRTAELQLGIESWWGFGAWSCSGRYPERRPSGLRPPGRRRQPSVARAAWSCEERERGDHAARASDGLPPCFNDAPWMRSPWVARYRHCAHRAPDLNAAGKHNAVPGTPRPRRWGARVGEVVAAGRVGYFVRSFVISTSRCSCRTLTSVPGG